MDKNSKKLPILRVVEHDGKFKRFTIEDEKKRQWNGNRFSKLDKKPLLYASHNAVATDLHEILKQNFSGGTVKYVVPVFIEVHSDDPVRVDEIAQYLSASAKLFIDTTTHGNGPGSSLVTPWIDWSRIEQMKEFPKD